MPVMVSKEKSWPKVVFNRFEDFETFPIQNIVLLAYEIPNNHLISEIWNPRRLFPENCLHNSYMGHLIGRHYFR